MRAWPIATLASLALAACAAPPAGDAPRPDGGGGAPQRLRVMTFNIEDARTGAIASGEDERLRRVGAVVRALRPDVLLINEIAADPGLENARRFVDAYVAPPPEYDVLMLPSNTGEHSGLDLDRNGRVDPEPGSRDYAGDCFGWGEFPGQYAMALLVRRGLEIDRERVRTFRALRWADMPGALLPPGPGGEGSWYDDDELAVFRLSSKSHWDVPIRLENGATLHALCSHPTPPVFDGDEDRNGRRNHDEIRFWADYLDGADWIVDDGGARGGLAPDALFVLLGDLNADPRRGLRPRPDGPPPAGAPAGQRRLRAAQRRPRRRAGRDRHGGLPAARGLRPALGRAGGARRVGRSARARGRRLAERPLRGLRRPDRPRALTRAAPTGWSARSGSAASGGPG